MSLFYRCEVHVWRPIALTDTLSYRRFIIVLGVIKKQPFITPTYMSILIYIKF